MSTGITYLSFPDRNRTYTDVGSQQMAAAAISSRLQNIVKEVTVETLDWTGPVTDYDKAANIGNQAAYRADFVHNMNNTRVVAVAMFTGDGYQRRILIDPQNTNENTTRIWILASQAPPYDVTVLFLSV